MLHITIGIEVAFAILVLIVFVNRYIVGTILLLEHHAAELEQDPAEWPSVSIIVPVFNEGEHIRETAFSLASIDYPAEKLSVLFVDDCSTDDTPQHLLFATRVFPHMQMVRNSFNIGKRLGIREAVAGLDSELILSVDSDVVVERDALKHLVRHLLATRTDAVGGCVYVSNGEENWLTRMQSVKYWIGYNFLKNVENRFEQVLCLSGCLTLYRRSALLSVDQELVDRRFLGDEVKYGEDRFLTRKLVEAGYKTRITFKARCYTKAPAAFQAYVNQQLRWRRSNLVDFFSSFSALDRLHPVIFVHYSAVALVQLFYPIFLISEFLCWGFFRSMLIHAFTMIVFAVLYECHKRELPIFAQVSGIWFASMTVVLPVLYITMTPLALATLATTAWETRKKRQVCDTTAPEAASHVIELEIGHKRASPMRPPSADVCDRAAV